MSSISNPLHPSVNCFLRTIGSFFVLSSTYHRPALSEVFVSDVLVAEKWECTLRQPGTFLSAAVCTLPRHTTRSAEQDQSPLVRSAKQRVRKKLRPQRQESTKRQRRWLNYKKQHWGAEKNLRVKSEWEILGRDVFQFFSKISIQKWFSFVCYTN